LPGRGSSAHDHCVRTIDGGSGPPRDVAVRRVRHPASSRLSVASSRLAVRPLTGKLKMRGTGRPRLARLDLQRVSNDARTGSAPPSRRRRAQGGPAAVPALGDLDHEPSERNADTNASTARLEDRALLGTT
jgi:hypothetical protein